MAGQLRVGRESQRPAMQEEKRDGSFEAAVHGRCGIKFLVTRGDVRSDAVIEGGMERERLAQISGQRFLVGRRTAIRAQA